MDVWSREEELIRRNAALDNRASFPSSTPLRKSRSISRIPLRCGVSPEKRTLSHLRSESSKNDAKEHQTKVRKGRTITKKEDSGDPEEYPSWSKELEVLKKEKTSLQSKLDRLSETDSKRGHEVTELKLKLSEGQRAQSNLAREVEEKERNNKKLDSQNKSLSVRLDRQEDTITKLRNEINELKELNKGYKESSRLEKEEMSRSYKGLERNLEKLATAYSKQQDLVEVLKKQKLHLEAAHVLQFTEEEFLKALNWNCGPRNVDVPEEINASA
eukprot:TRINITY_DN5459_c0_g1_i1.p1 TRINITY_DN5459_c0_g1~~TRINITY_DN5459_c0_g1_i1.p1  ORF type:complete len:286 (+),score=69.21 TRINITY_DN5459_c0_g1_i1:43-858(+)